MLSNSSLVLFCNEPVYHLDVENVRRRGCFKNLNSLLLDFQTLFGTVKKDYMAIALKYDANDVMLIFQPLYLSYFVKRNVYSCSNKSRNHIVALSRNHGIYSTD